MLHAGSNHTIARIIRIPLTDVEVVVGYQGVIVSYGSGVVSSANTIVLTRLDVLPNHHMTTRNNLPAIAEVNHLFGVHLLITYNHLTLFGLFNDGRILIPVRISTLVLAPREIVCSRGAAVVVLSGVSIHVSHSVDAQVGVLDIYLLCGGL